MAHVDAHRCLTAASLLSLIVVACARSSMGDGQRSLLANKPSSGGLHAVAALPTNYMVTNGNGSWTYTPYSSPATAGYAAVNAAYGNTAVSLASAPTVIGASSAAGLSSSQYSGCGSLDCRYISGSVNSIVFPSKNLGIAVGANGDLTNQATMARILITVDGGITWSQVTGLPTVAAADGAADITVSTPYPAVTSGDLNAVYMASKSTGWAVGGTLSASPYWSYNYNNQPGTSGLDALNAAVILMTTNGGTVWKEVPLYYTKSQAAAVWSSTPDALASAKALYAQSIPGALFGVQSDASGKNIYAVGAPMLSATVAAGDTTVDWVYSYVGTILFSSNGGASWTQQTAPVHTLPNFGNGYSLLSVALTKGSTAWAVGGDLYENEYTSIASGTIIGTTNGGFSWKNLNYPVYPGASAPIFTTVSVNNGLVWVAGAFLHGGNDYYPVIATKTSPGLNYNVLVSMDGVNFVGALAYSSFPAGFVASSTCGSYAGGTNCGSSDFSGYKNVYGITWDNTVHGWLFGNSFLLATHDGGKTWVSELPNVIATGAVPGVYAGLPATSSDVAYNGIYAMASVPTTY